MESSLHALALLVASNATPVLLSKVAGTRATFPVDFGYVMRDGERLLGSHKTWRGLFAGIAAGALTAWLLNLSPRLGAEFALLSLIADATSSFIKRRMRLKPGTEFLGLDQLGETLLPLAVFATPLALGFGDILVVAAIFIVIDVATTPLRRQRWFDRERDR